MSCRVSCTHLELVLGIAHLDGAVVQAHVAAGGRAVAVGLALVGSGCGSLVGAEGQLIAVLRQVLASRGRRAAADELPTVLDVADLDARVVGRAAVGAESARVTLLRRGGEGQGSEGEDGGGDVLHFGG